MNIADVCIRRPVLTLMLMLALLVFGVLGYSRLGVDQFPSMEFPIVITTAILPGAAPEVVEEDVTDVLEEHINTVPGLRSLRSQTSAGLATVIAEFELGRDIDTAAQDTRDKIARARGLLPVDLEPPVVDKVNPADQAILWIPLITDRGPVASTEFLKNQVVPHLETIPGVAAVTLFGRRERAIRIWLDGEALRARGLAATDVLAALRREHVEIPGGRVESRNVEYSVKTAAEFTTIADLEGLVVAHRGEAPVYLRDVGRVEDGSEDPRAIAFYNGRESVGLGLQKQSLSNTVAIADEAYRRMARLRELMPAGMSMPEASGIIDFSLAIRESVNETIFALVTGALLATLTVWGFLRRTRPTLIVGAAIPLSLVGTFGVMWLAGFTLNTMTLLALALAVGVVIDDAIIVLENIERHREAGATPREAASSGTREIAFAAVVATASIAVVFLPVAAVKGIVGNFLREFGLTVAAAVVISLMVALTLTPMLAARMPPPAEREHGSIYHWLELAFLWLERLYRRMLDWSLAHRAATLGIAVASFVGAIVLAGRIGTEFFPPEDQGRFFAMMETPPGTTLEATRGILERDMSYFLAQPEVVGLFSAIGVGGPGRPGRTNQAVMVSILRPQKERERSAQELVRQARADLARIPGQRLQIIDTMTMTSGTRQAAFEVELRGSVSLQELDALADRMMAGLAARPGMVDLHKSLQLGLPEIRVIPDREKAAALGVDAQSMASVVQAMIGGVDVASFKEGGRRYDIRVRLEEKDRTTPEAIQRLYARARDGEVVELGNLVRIETGAAPSTITRSNRQRSVSVSAQLEAGKTLGSAIADTRALAAEVLPEGVTLHLSGAAEAFRESAGQFGFAILVGLIVIYMVLAAQFESLIHPLTVMLALPLAMVGALGGLLVCGMTINLFSMIGIVLLFGLVTKNSILLVDYANQLRERGMDKYTAMHTAAPVRMRPVLMTAISMIFGVIPAAVGLGPGSESRAPMAVATAFGMFSSMLLTLIVVPVFYLVVDDAVDWLRQLPARLLRRAAPPRPESPGISSRAAG